MRHRGRRNVYDMMEIEQNPPPTRPKPPRNRAEAPDHLSERMKGWWRQVVVEHDLDSHHFLLLEQAANAWDRCETAKTVVEEGTSYLNEKGEPRPRPEVAVERDARLCFVRIIKELDLDPPPVQQYNSIGWPIPR
jgi:phage terminase small subunit